MTYKIEINSEPNQRLSVNLDGSRYEITLNYAAGCMCASVTRDGSAVVSGHRMVAGEPVLPYRHLEQGNFVLSTENGAAPDYNKFGVTQFLYYVPQGDIDAIRAEA